MIYQRNEMYYLERSKTIQKLLFRFIIAMLIPTITYSTIVNNIMVLTILMSISYVLMYCVFICYLRSLSRTGIAFTLFFIIMSLLNLGYIAFSKEIFDYQDAASMITRYLSYFLFFILLRKEILYREDLERFLYKFIILSIAACVYNIIINRGNFGQLASISSSYEVNFKSFFGNRNQFGGFLFLSNIALVNYYQICKKRSNLLVASIAGIVNINLLLTMSRSAILATIIFFSLLIFYFLSKLNYKAMILTIISFSAVCYSLNSSKIVEFIKKYFIRSTAGDSGRIYIWGKGIQIFLEGNIFLGSGANAAIKIAQTQGVRVNQFHNFFIETLVDGGIVNLLLVMGTITYVLFRIFNNKSNGYSTFKYTYFFSLIALVILLSVESVNFFGMGLVETLYSIFFIAIPLLITNTNYKVS